MASSDASQVRPRLRRIFHMLVWAVLSSAPVYASKVTEPKFVSSSDFEKELRSGQRGPLLAGGEYAELRTAVQGLYSKIHPQIEQRVQELTGSKNPIPFHIHWLDTPVPNAFMTLTTGPELQIVIHTGLLQYALQKSPPGEEAVALGKLLGFVAHEGAHTVDWMDPHGIGATRGNSQNVELRTDVEATLALRKSGFPEDLLYQGLESLGENYSDQISNLEAFLGTHPEFQARLSAMRLGETLFRRELGAAPSSPIEVPAPVLAELRAFRHRKTPPIQVDLAAAVERLKEIDQKLVGLFHQYTKDMLCRERSVLIDRIGQYLLDLPHGLSKADEGAYLELARYTILDAKGLSQELASNSYFSKVAEKLALNNNLEFRAKIGKLLAERTAAPLKPSEYVSKPARRFFIAAEDASRFYPRTKIAFDYHDQLVPLLKPNPGEVDLSEAGAVQRFCKPGESPVFFRKYVNPGLPDAMRERLLIENLGYGEFIGYRTNVRTDLWTPKELDEVRNRTLAGLDAEGRRTYGEIAAELWKNRGRVALLDFVSKTMVTDWEGVCKALNIPWHEGKREIQRAAREFASTDGFGPFLDQLKNYSSNSLRTSWTDASCVDLFNPKDPRYAKLSPERKGLLWKHLSTAYLKFEKGALKERAFRLLDSKSLVRGGVQPELKSLKVDLLAETFGVVEDSSLWQLHDHRLSLNEDLRLWVGEWVDAKSSLSREQKKQWLRSLFDVGNHGEVETWAWSNESTRIADLLVKNGVVESYSDYAKLILTVPPPRSARDVDCIRIDQQLRAFLGLRERLVREWKAMKPPHAGRELVRALISPWIKVSPQGMAIDDGGMAEYWSYEARLRSPEFDTLKVAALKQVAAYEDSKDAVKLFEEITQTGTSHGLDEVFLANIFPKLGKQDRSSIFFILRERRIHEPANQSKLAAFYLGHQDDTSRWSARELDSHLVELQHLAPAASPARDEYLEDLLWRHQIESAVEIEKVERLKSTQPRNQHAKTGRGFSGISKYADELDVDARVDLIEYLANATGGDLPPSIQKAIRRSVQGSLDSTRKTHGQSAADHAEDLAMEAATAEISAFVRTGNPEDRLAMIELLIGYGHFELLKKPAAVDRVIHGLLGYERGSGKEKCLRAYLDSVREVEQPSTLGYLLTHRGSGDEGFKSIFEVFKTVGIKGGQVGSIWKLFPPEVRDSIRGLKDSAKPMTKKEILHVLDTTMAPAERARIKRVVKRLGSASVKNVVLVELVDGTEAVVMVRRPNIEPQIKENLRLAKAFVKNLKKQGFEFNDVAVSDLFDAMEEQLWDEIRFKNEAEKIARAKEVFGKLNAELADVLGEWKFEAPGLQEGFTVHDNLLIMEKAEGVTLNQSEHEPPAGVLKGIGKAFVRAFVKFGYWEPDPHRGNLIVDFKAKRIRPIDLGQTMHFTLTEDPAHADEVFHVAEFLRAFSMNDGEALLKHGLAMRRPGEGSPDLARLRAGIRSTLGANESQEDRLLDLVRVFGEGNARLSTKMTFGIMKGLVVLNGEKYLSEEEMRAELGQEIVGLLGRKSGALMRTVAEAPEAFATRPGVHRSCLFNLARDIE